MPSTFFGLTIATSGLNAYQVALNTTANNISNVQTEGYTRQVANRTASESIRVYQKYGAVGTGVTTTSIKQVRNQYYDAKYWYNQSSVGLYETRLNYLQQIENYFIDDDTSKGFSTILNTMFNALDTLKNNASDVNVRQQFIGSAQNLATYFNSVSLGLTDIQESANDEIKSTVMNINAIAEKIAILNKQINVIEIQGAYANELRDQRALLIDELSAIVPTEVSETPVTDTNHPDEPTGATYYTVKIGGQLLVDTYEYNSLECVARENKVNQSDSDGLYEIKWEKTGNTFAAGASYMSGSLKALFDIRDGNNGENFTGAASVVSSTEVRIDSPSINTIAGITMPEEGTLHINGRDYNYIGFTYEEDADGNIISYTFELEDALSTEERAKVDGKSAAIGSAVDSMGVPYYMAQMNQFLRSFAADFNSILKQGVDLDGKKTDYYAFFTGEDAVSGEEYVFDGLDEAGNAVKGSASDSYYKLTAANICVSSLCVKDPSLLATTVDITGKGGVDAYDLVEDLAKLKSDVVLYRGGTADGFLKCMIADISIDTQESEIFSKNYANIASTIESQRMSISGVDEDEEALDLIKFQNAYNLSSKMISVMAEVYDRLILETGV
ncbi:MAG: flagellar hook-associated protein FlgK [Roseburia sp.]|nr:flagellar hook-associated protein FlgK [Roseburia sp.]